MTEASVVSSSFQSAFSTGVGDGAKRNRGSARIASLASLSFKADNPAPSRLIPHSDVSFHDLG